MANGEWGVLASRLGDATRRPFVGIVVFVEDA